MSKKTLLIVFIVLLTQGTVYAQTYTNNGQADPFSAILFDITDKEVIITTKNGNYIRCPYTKLNNLYVYKVMNVYPQAIEIKKGEAILYYDYGDPSGGWYGVTYVLSPTKKAEYIQQTLDNSLGKPDYYPSLNEYNKLWTQRSREKITLKTGVDYNEKKYYLTREEIKPLPAIASVADAIEYAISLINYDYTGYANRPEGTPEPYNCENTYITDFIKWKYGVCGAYSKIAAGILVKAGVKNVCVTTVLDKNGGGHSLLKVGNTYYEPQIAGKPGRQSEAELNYIEAWGHDTWVVFIDYPVVLH